MHTMNVPIVLRYVRSILLVSCIFSFSHIHTSLISPRSNQELWATWQQFFIKNFISPHNNNLNPGNPGNQQQALGRF